MSTLGFLYILVYAIILAIDVFASLLVASAARRKDRSFGAFFWLSLLLGVLIPALVVAALPFRDDDPRKPSNKRG
ncbi:MAG TPA: hypothetical protein VGF80_01025 [Galbitalea sp.]|jgi:hypothetical protein